METRQHSLMEYSDNRNTIIGGFKVDQVLTLAIEFIAYPNIVT
ncbi:hypothetical protein C427_3313 [Paraglaciecola psychrophila 170]|uniref:Uncharacterized protein n=1 Tax=Paraglaciecola psychrophila 170 TaxID=1129794 RepID=K6ZQ62_9ALTE|nr:hypothetical protein C427_3313 [Paraglaciecola psychrophila 170]GAC38091.1 hypothetical protein GPSY_2475 [Paraglaciecola psychrophila 170]